MIVCRYQSAEGPQWGEIEDGQVYALGGSPLGGDVQRGGRVGPVEDVTRLAPIQPGKIIAVGRNFAAHAAEQGAEVPANPLLFFKPPSTVIGPGETIELLPEHGRVDIEGEMAVVIGKVGRFIQPEDALNHVFGYTCANDISDRDFQRAEPQWVRAKAFDTFCPLGPWIVTDFDPAQVTITSRINGEQKQHGNTHMMIFNIPTLIAYISRVMTLNPGDVILTGTPEGVSPIKDGDVTEVEVEDIGVLRSPVKLINA